MTKQTKNQETKKKEEAPSYSAKDSQSRIIPVTATVDIQTLEKVFGKGHVFRN